MMRTFAFLLLASTFLRADVLILKDALSTVLKTKLQLLDARVERSLASNRRRALVEPLRTPTTESMRK